MFTEVFSFFFLLSIFLSNVPIPNALEDRSKIFGKVDQWLIPLHLASLVLGCAVVFSLFWIFKPIILLINDFMFHIFSKIFAEQERSARDVLHVCSLLYMIYLSVFFLGSYYIFLWIYYLLLVAIFNTRIQCLYCQDISNILHRFFFFFEN